MHDMAEKYPMWEYDDLMDLKAQFQTFDVNQDGLIDFTELWVIIFSLFTHYI